MFTLFSIYIYQRNQQYSLSRPLSMSSCELQRSTAPNPAESKFCGNDLDLVVAAAVLTTVLLGYCCILQRLSSAFCGSTPGNRSENPDAGDPTEEIGNAGQQITILGCLPMIRSRGFTSRNRVENPDADDPAQEIHSGGLELVILESLRVSEFRKNNEGEHSEGSATCAVCLGEFEEGQRRTRTVPSADRRPTMLPSTANTVLAQSRVGQDHAKSHIYKLSMHPAVRVHLIHPVDLLFDMITS